MKLLILAHNPKYIPNDNLISLAASLKRKGIEVEFIEHYHEHEEPIYSVQWMIIKDESEQVLQVQKGKTKSNKIR